MPEKLIAADKASLFKIRETGESKVLLAPYAAAQVYMAAISNRGEKFDPNIYPVATLYNEYFGGGMNSIVFQGLAYSASAGLGEPSRLDKPYIYSTFIATQNDKMGDALTAFDEVINHMPESEAAFNLAKEALIARLRTDRITGAGIFDAYQEAKDLGLDSDRRKMLLKDFQEKWVKDRKYTYCVLGDEKELDMKKLSSYGPVERLTTEQIFGY